MIKKILCLCMAVFCLGWFTTADAAPMKKKTVAVPEVAVECSGNWGRSAATILYGEIINALVNSGTCEVMERVHLEKVMRELRLQNSGAIEGSTAIQFGQLSGTQYTVSATVYEAVVGRFDNVLYKGTKAKVRVDFRFIDNKTGKIITNKMIEGTKTVSEFENNSADHRMLIGRAVSDAAEQIVEELKGVTVGTIVKVSGDLMYLDIGSNMGVTPKDKYLVYRLGEPLVHPVTGDILGVEEITIGEVVITEVKPDYSVAKIKKCEDIVKAGDQVKRVKRK